MFEATLKYFLQLGARTARVGDIITIFAQAAWLAVVDAWLAVTDCMTGCNGYKEVTDCMAGYSGCMAGCQ